MASAFYIYAIGIVAKDKLEDSLMIKVYPIERIPNKENNPLMPENISANILNNAGENISIEAIKQEIINAKWIPIGNSNRISAPDVCKGERVFIYKYGDRDEYYWDTMYNEINLRKNEKVTYVFSNKKTIEDKSLLGSVYYFTIDTINKLLRLHTDASDGEAVEYDLDINTKDGTLIIKDSKDNFIELNSVDDTINIKTNSIINIESDELVTVTSSVGEVTLDNLNITVNENKDETVKGRYDIKVGNYTVSNGSDELISLLGELTQAIIDAKWIGNLGADCPIEGGTKSTFADIKSRIEAFK